LCLGDAFIPENAETLNRIADDDACAVRMPEHLATRPIRMHRAADSQEQRA
jgi:hypothetical protein